MSQSLNAPQKGLLGAFDRFTVWFGRMFTVCDQCFAVWVRGWIYVYLGGELPSADETLSSWVGRCAIAGHRAGLIAEKVIDFLLQAPGHCRAAIARDDDD